MATFISDQSFGLRLVISEMKRGLDLDIMQACMLSCMHEDYTIHHS